MSKIDGLTLHDLKRAGFLEYPGFDLGEFVRIQVALTDADGLQEHPPVPGQSLDVEQVSAVDAEGLGKAVVSLWSKAPDVGHREGVVVANDHLQGRVTQALPHHLNVRTRIKEVACSRRSEGTQGRVQQTEKVLSPFVQPEAEFRFNPRKYLQGEGGDGALDFGAELLGLRDDLTEEELPLNDEGMPCVDGLTGAEPHGQNFQDVDARGRLSESDERWDFSWYRGIGW